MIEKNSITTRLATKKFWPLNLWQPKAFHHQLCGDEKILVTTSLTT